MIQPAVERYENVKQYSMEKVTSVKDYGVQKASDLMETQYGQAVAATLTKTIDKADQYMDYYLPPKEGEEQTDTKLSAEDGLVDKLSKVSTKVKRRVSNITLAEVENVQKRTRETLSHLHVVLDLVQNAKTNLNTQAVQERLSALQVKAKALWEDLNKEQPADSETPKTLEQQSLALARYLTQSLVTFYNKSSQSLSTLPVSLHPTITQMQQYGTELFAQVTKITKLDDVTAVVMTQVHDKSKAIQETVTSLRDSAMKLQPLEWVGNGSPPEEETQKQATQEHN
jgi:perilipin-2